MTETATQPTKITVCDKCFTVACWNGTVMCSRARSAGTITDTPENISKMAYGLVPAPQETPVQQGWFWLHSNLIDPEGRIVLTVANGITTDDAHTILNALNRSPAFQKLVEAAEAALVNIQGLLDNDDLPSIVVRNMLREALCLAREGEE